MWFRRLNLSPLFCILFLWRFCKVKAYVDVCETVSMTVYCNCEELSFRDASSLYRVSCILLQTVTQTDPVWRSIGDAENISHLKLQPRLPLKLEYIPSDELSRMRNLKILRIQEGSLGTLKAHAISGYKSLEELELEGNEIVALDSNAISNLPKLKKLALSENQMQELLADSLSELLELEILFLDRNNISRIETCAFCNLQNLKELELWGNQISDLTEYTFRGLRYLRRLDLYKNKIRILNDKVFHTMPRLAEIDLRDNAISHVAARTFNGLDKLQRLALGNNNIKVLPYDVFASMPQLRSVDLYNNSMEILQAEVVDNMKNSKDPHFVLTFRENPYNCDCAMQWVATYLKATESHTFIRELKEVLCKTENGTKTPVADYLENVDCKISSIKPRTPLMITHSVTKSTDSVPIELHSQKSKPLSTAFAASGEEDEAYFSDVVDDKGDMGGGAATTAWAFDFLVLCMALLTAYSSRSGYEM